MAAPLAVNKLVLQQTNSRKTFSVQIQSLTLLENLAAKKTSRTEKACEPDDILADQITQGIQQHLAHSGLSDAAWSLLTSDYSITDVESVALALVMHLRGAGGLDSFGGIADRAVRLMLRVTPQASTGKKSQGASTSTEPDTGASSKGEPALTAGMAWNKIKHLVPVRKDHRIVYKCGNAGPELIADQWSKLPPDATTVWGNSRFAGQPLVPPHADEAECWITMEDALAHVSWHLQGAKDGALDDVKANVTRSMQQLAKRIANGHKHQQGVASAVQLAPSSKDLKTQEHAENAANYHVKYGALYDRRDQTPPMLPRVVVDWLRTLREGAAQAAPLSQLYAFGATRGPDFIHNLVRDAGWGTASRAAAAAGTDGAAAPGDEPADLAGAVPAAGAAAVGSARSRMRALR